MANAFLAERSHPLLMPSPSILEAALGVWQIVLPWTRSYILTDGKVFSLVDTGTCRDLQAVRYACAALNLDLANCCSILLTHGHCDHAGNVASLAEQTGAKIYAHREELPFLETPLGYGRQTSPAPRLQRLIFQLGEFHWPVRRCTVDVIVAEGDRIETPSGVWRVLHTPGHTPGHVGYFREADGVLLSGDAIVNILPYIRIEGLSLSQPIFSTDMAQARRSACRLAELEPRILLPGHGPPLRNRTAERIKSFVQCNHKSKL